MERGLQGNTHHDENRQLERKLPQSNRKNLAHDTLVSMCQKERTCVRSGDGLSGILTNNSISGTVEGLSMLPQPESKKPPQREPLTQDVRPADPQIRPVPPKLSTVPTRKTDDHDGRPF